MTHRIAAVLTALVCAVLGVAPLTLSAQNGPDFKAPRYTKLLADYNTKIESLKETCHKETGRIIDGCVKDAAQKIIKAKVTGNAGAKADSAELEKVFKAIKAAYAKGEAISIPEKVRPGNERALATFARDLKTCNNDLERSSRIQLMHTRDELRQLLETDGFKANAEADLERYWTAFVESTPQGQTTAGGDETSPDAVDADPEDAGDAAVYATFGQAKKWKRFARIDIALRSMEIISVPLFPMEKGKTQVRGQGISGTSWQAFVSAPVTVARPAKKVAFRLKAVEGMSRIEPMTWPSASNNWTFELRVKPSSDDGASACLIEIGE